MSLRLSSAISVRSKPISSLRRARRLTYGQLASMPSSSTLRSQPPNTGSQYPDRICSLLFQVVDQRNKRIETDDLGALGNKVGEGVDVVEVGLAVAIIDDVFHTAHFDPCGLHDAFHGADHIVRRAETLDAQPVLWSVHGAGNALQFLAAGGFADVGRAQI